MNSIQIKQLYHMFMKIGMKSLFKLFGGKAHYNEPTLSFVMQILILFNSLIILIITTTI